MSSAASPNSMATDAALARHRDVQRARLVLARAEATLERTLAQVPADEMDAYREAATVAEVAADGQIAAVRDRAARHAQALADARARRRPR